VDGEVAGTLAEVDNVDERNVSSRTMSVNRMKIPDCQSKP